ncbi:hypothetical protein [Paenibacillus wynnii]|uniref:Uncharacterized protein n=1 Tax=Paenibacillus wynnii TaxID=268407 RepID=A0A098MFD7_9BACL|nr:hypothetical protein [Paenibacillus wynnii]KGE20766.1 hypothetical protein PWYN_00880 [Paenibacillus wynnii]
MNFRNLMSFHWKDYRRAALTLFSVLILVDLLQVVLWRFFPSMDTGDANNLFGINRVIILIFTVINVIVTASITFPLMVGFSVTRRNFYATTLLALVLFCISAALVESLLFELGKSVLPTLEMEVSSGKPFLTHWYVFTVSLLLVGLIALLISSSFTRLGASLGTLSVVAYIVILNLFANIMPSLDFIDEPGMVTLVSDTPLMLIVIALLGIVGWLLFRRASVKV